MAKIPTEPGWLYEPKWDGFRCLAFRHGDEVVLQSKAGQPLGRYFPEMVEALRELPARTFVLDGEIVIFENSGEKSGMDSGDSHSKRPRRARASYENPEEFSRQSGF